MEMKFSFSTHFHRNWPNWCYSNCPYW